MSSVLTPDADPFTFTIYKWGRGELVSLLRMHKLVATAQRWGLKGCRVKDDETGLEFSWKPL